MAAEPPPNLSDRAARLHAVAAGIRASLEGIDQVVAGGTSTLRRARDATGDRALTLACGAYVHAFYNELEKLFEPIAVELDAFEPSGHDWHTRLADRMFVEVPGQRPALLPPSLRSQLDDYLRFRHLFRHLYVLNLDVKRVELLSERLEEFWLQARASLERFCASLDAIANALSQGPG